MRFLPTISLLLCALFALSACDSKEEVGKRGLNSEAFYARYNKYIVNWLAGEKQRSEGELAEKRAKLAAATEPEEQKRLAGSIAESERELAKFEFRQSLGNYFDHKDIADLPEGLVWENGDHLPDIGDPAAKKGGTFRYFISSFPPTLRQIGANSNNSFRGEIYELISVYLVDLHPVTQEVMPGLAKEWAIGPDNRTVFFRIHPEAKFNDGEPVEAEDFLTWARLRLSDHVENVWFAQYLREQIAKLTVYAPDLIAITLPEEKPLLPYYAGQIDPAPTHFYDDFGPDFEERYQWVVPPSTAAYRVNPEDIVKGESITLTRDQDWWAKDMKFYRNRFNADKIFYRVVLDVPKAWELFRAGEIDYFGITLPDFYYEKSEMPPVFNGYVERTTWYNQYPRIPWGFYLNTAEAPLDNGMVRRGIAYASNWEKVIDVIFRGDFSRLQSFTSGYSVTNLDIEARPFSIRKAREAFAQAGYDREDSDGILMNENGSRLEVILSYSSNPSRTAMLVIIKEEARRAGLNLILDAREGTASYKLLMSKEHQISFTAWGFTPPSPAYYEYFHSRNAFDEKGNRKTQTNNVFSYADDRMDFLTTGFRNARTPEEQFQFAQEIQQIVADKDLFIPGYTNEFSRVATWRWVRWPDVEETRFSPPLAYSPIESYCYWIDEEIKEETLAAKRTGTSFPEVERVFDDYRVTSSGGDEPVVTDDGQAEVEVQPSQPEEEAGNDPVPAEETEEIEETPEGGSDDE